MIDIIDKVQIENAVLIWNPEFVIKKSDATGNHIISFPVQHSQLLNFKHFKVLTKFDIKLDLDKVDNWGIYKYCDGATTINEVCTLITAQYPAATRTAVTEKIKKLAGLGLITVM